MTDYTALVEAVQGVAGAINGLTVALVFAGLMAFALVLALRYYA